MNLNRHAREFYTLGIVTQPPITTWEASFDAGRTWHPGEQVGQDTRWLLRGSAIPDDPARPRQFGVTERPVHVAVTQRHRFVGVAPRSRSRAVAITERAPQ